MGERRKANKRGAALETNMMRSDKEAEQTLGKTVARNASG